MIFQSGCYSETYLLVKLVLLGFRKFYSPGFYCFLTIGKSRVDSSCAKLMLAIAIIIPSIVMMLLMLIAVSMMSL